ncbi:MAG TPA: hypothetical protein PKE27_17315 [Povalibacter sp.]|uniref:hypothetical protein n=1 Tax=Povalibacter sp. TaxID=1962978 RepID=UPI002C0CA2AD|nr:hypothetical protein [Povalibacter sp.]HMN46341.1 hypothetical protein [Povalibacter sp.]
MHGSARVLLLLLLLAGPAGAGALSRLTAELPDLPAPPQGSVHWVAPAMRMNGLPMTLKTFESRLAPADVFHFYEGLAHRWGRSELRRSRRGTGQLLSIRTRDHLISIEATATVSGSSGTLVVSVVPEQAGAVASSRFPRPASARLVSLQEYEDDGIASEHLSLSSARSIAVETAAFSDALTRAGWQVLRQQPMQTAARGMVIEAQRGAELALLTLQPDRTQSAATAIVIVWRKS